MMKKNSLLDKGLSIPTKSKKRLKKNYSTVSNGL